MAPPRAGSNSLPGGTSQVEQLPENRNAVSREDVVNGDHCEVFSLCLCHHDAVPRVAVGPGQCGRCEGMIEGERHYRNPRPLQPTR